MKCKKSLNKNIFNLRKNYVFISKNNFAHRIIAYLGKLLKFHL